MNTEKIAYELNMTRFVFEQNSHYQMKKIGSKQQEKTDHLVMSSDHMSDFNLMTNLHTVQLELWIVKRW